MKARTLGVKDILNKKYKVLENVPEWITNTFGVLPDPFHIQVIGRPKNGKTSVIMKFAKDMSIAGYHTWYNSKEEGDSKTVQDAYLRVDMKKAAGKMFLGDGYYYQDMREYLKDGAGKRKKIVIIDSLDYIKLTKKQYIQLIEENPTKSFVVICWGGKKGTEWVCDDYYGNQIKHMMGMITGVQSFIVESRGRYGPTEPYSIWPERYPIKKNGNGQIKLAI